MLRFTKLEGCGNDFVVVDLREGGPVSGYGVASPDNPEAARALCDRRFGVGGDGVLAILPATVDGAVARMRVLNADGSEAEMCGNGIRCVAKYLYERDPQLRLAELPIETGAGVLTCGVTVDKRRRVTHVAVEMGRPRLTRREIPMVGPEDERVIGVEVQIAGRWLKVTGVSMGNPHAIAFIDGAEPLRAIAEQQGPALETHVWFPQKTNAEFARVDGGAIELVVWERGCGITLACGTGACATAVAAALMGKIPAGREVPVKLLGGELLITVAADLSGVTMRGPAEEVYEGEVDLPSLLSRRAPLANRAG